MKKLFKEVDELWDELVDMDLFTHKELELVTSINGYSVETLNSAIYARYGYRDLEQIKEEW